MISWFGRARADRPATCRQVVAFLQAFLDGETDDITAYIVAEHLEDCRRCGLEATTYTQIKDSLAGRGAVTSEAVQRLRAFGQRLAHCNDEGAAFCDCWEAP